MKKITENRKSDESYRMRVYPVTVENGMVEWVAEVPDLPGCVGAGDTAEEAVQMAIDAQKAWIDVAIEDGKQIPEPSSLNETDYSGKFTLRLPKTLHRELALNADDEGVSLNQYILYLIAIGLNKETSATKENDKEIYKLEVKTTITTNNVIENWRKVPVISNPFAISNVMSRRLSNE